MEFPNSQRSLLENDRRFRHLVESVTDYAIYMLDLKGLVTNWNAGAERAKGYPTDEILGRHFSCFYLAEDQIAGLPDAALMTARQTGRFEAEGWRVRKDGTKFWAHVVIDLVTDDDQVPIGFAKITRDLTEHAKARCLILESERRFRHLVQNVRDLAIYMLDGEGNVTSWNLGAERLKGFNADEIVGRHFSIFYTAEDQEKQLPAFALAVARESGRFETEGFRVRSDGRQFWAHVVIDTVCDDSGQHIGFAKVTRDITRQKHDADAIRDLAERDALTKVANRRVFHDMLEQRVLAAKNANRPATLLLIDVDDFKSVNDLHGHLAGDALITWLAQQIRSVLRTEDLVGRLGGDEFGVMLGTCSKKSAAAIGRRILSAISSGFYNDGFHSIIVSASIGITMITPESRDASSVVAEADLALYEAKRLGKDTFTFFSLDLERRIRGQRQLEFDLREAVATGSGLEIHYQPIFSTKSGLVTGREALLRWRHPEMGLLKPDQFIPLSEKAGLITSLGEWVMKQACVDASNWPSTARVAVNVSSVQLTREFPRIVAAILSATNLTSSRLEMEITEGVLLEHSAAKLNCLRQLKKHGLSIALDDFGRGYTSLSYLRDFPFDRVKIDGSFIRDAQKNRVSATIVELVTKLGQRLEIPIVAEGIETVEQLRFAYHQGCEEVQGYLLGLPSLKVEEGLNASSIIEFSQKCL